MKKPILSLTIICSGVFAHATMLSNKCIDLAFAVEDIVGHEISYEMFDAIVRACEAM